MYRTRDEFLRVCEEAFFDPLRRPVLDAALRVRERIKAEEAIKRYLAHAQKNRRHMPSYTKICGYTLRKIVRETEIEYLDELEIERLEEYCDCLDVDPHTVRNHLAALGGLLRWAHRNRHVSENAARLVDAPRLQAKEIVFVPPELINKVLKTVAEDPLVEGAVATALFAGLRRGEIQWLQPQDVDLDRRVLKVRAKAVGAERWEPKTHKNREVPINSRLWGYLKRQTEQAPASTWLFPAEKGGRWNGNKLGPRVRELIRKIVPKQAPEGFAGYGFREFRHTYATILAAQGVPLGRIAEYMGNSVLVIERYYRGFLPSQHRDEVEFRLLEAT